MDYESEEGKKFLEQFVPLVMLVQISANFMDAANRIIKDSDETREKLESAYYSGEEKAVEYFSFIDASKKYLVGLDNKERDKILSKESKDVQAIKANIQNVNAFARYVLCAVDKKKLAQCFAVNARTQANIEGFKELGDTADVLAELCEISRTL